jgi:hypothetical protein
MEDLAPEQSSRTERSRDPQSATESVADRRAPQRECPWCTSRRTHFVQRGFTGPTDERDQYITCEGCGRTTLEIVSKTMREVRVGQFRAGATYRDSLRQSKYTITRVLKVGMKPIIRRDPT